ncbi:mediator of RNA polymerase II transcription subunit 11 [Carex littledalei]|uniref:Mediator of RNA polymerase II transcription subunit 11 n=1 Tax=Carex littledalei TaxID=544730 RepID=A0A833V996_9POAL|nr:mediator of RNA polymerase II transcription subunit 11 [Carex littledalei]
MSVLGSQGQSSSLQRLHYVEKRIVRLLELAGAAMDELGNASAPKTEVLALHCREFMMAIKSRYWYGVMLV